MPRLLDNYLTQTGRAVPNRNPDMSRLMNAPTNMDMLLNPNLLTADILAKQGVSRQDYEQAKARVDSRPISPSLTAGVPNWRRGATQNLPLAQTRFGRTDVDVGAVDMLPWTAFPAALADANRHRALEKAGEKQGFLEKYFMRGLVPVLSLGGAVGLPAKMAAKTIAKGLNKGLFGQTPSPSDLAREKRRLEALDRADLTKTTVGLLTPGKSKSMAEVPSIRDVQVGDAVAMASKEPHLIKGGKATRGFYVGGPSTVKSRKDLLAMRRRLDESIEAGVKGGTWYPRYVADIRRVTGGNPNEARWMAGIEGEFSAGVSPQTEVGAAIKETMGMIAGKPVKAQTPQKHKTFKKAVETGDPEDLAKGKKTGQYAESLYEKKLTAVGVNDFRWAREFGYTNPDGTPIKIALTPAQHKFIDYETALAVKRANEKNLGGGRVLTGPEIQAMGWVNQKSKDLYAERSKGFNKKALEIMKKQNRNDLSDEAVEAVARKLAFDEANRTGGDYFPKHIFSATHEFIPGSSFPGMSKATQAQREAIGKDPRSLMDIGPGNRDAFYAGTAVKETPGVAVRVEPSVPMTGVWTGASGVREVNPGGVARPLVGLMSRKNRPSIMEGASRDVVEKSELLRAALTGQDAGAGHIIIRDGPIKHQNAVHFTLPSKLTLDEIDQLQEIVKKYGYSDVSDTGRGGTLANFGGDTAHTPSTKEMEALNLEIQTIRPDAGVADRVYIDTVYQDLSDAWAKGEGSGEVSKMILEAFDESPELMRYLENNPNIAKVALNYLERDKDLAKQFGPDRKDLATLRKIVAEGPGWVQKITDGISKGILPASAMLLIGHAALRQTWNQNDTSLDL